MMSYSVRTNTEEVIEVEENIIAFEEVQVAVLDCRSGRPLANKKVKRIVVKQDDAAIIDVEFDRTVDHTLTVELADALKGLGFNDAEVKKGYKKYWEARDSSAKAADAAGEPFPVFEARVIDEYKRHRATDDNGILTLQLPRVFFNGHSISVEVGFWDFPVFLEAVNDDPRVQDLAPEPIRRDGVNIGGSVLLTDLGYSGTKFDIVWTGSEQSTEWNGNWGWEARRTSKNAAPIAPASGGMVSATYFLNSIGLNAGAGNQEVDMATEFKVSETIILKNNQAEVNMKAAQNVSILDSSLFSMFYVKGTNNSPFVLYGMQWCQPVWDGIEDPQGELVAGSSNENVYIQNPEYAHLNMHVVTDYKGHGIFNGQVVSAGGKEYGTTRHEYKHSFDIDSVDLMTGAVGAVKLFAIHGGNAARNGASNSSTGLYVTLICENSVFGTDDNKRGVRFLHLDSYSVDNNSYVMAGQEIGRAGRTGIPTQYPDHCHMDYGAGAAKHEASILNHRSELDLFNRRCIPHYELPLTMPCKSERAISISSCNFDCTTALNCWAAIELKCPALSNRSNASSDSQQVRVVQAQLRFLGYYNGALDGDNGAGTKDAISRYKAANASGLTSGYSFFVDGKVRPVPVSTDDEFKIDGLTRSESFENAGELSWDPNNPVEEGISQSISDLLLQWLNLEAPLPNYGGNTFNVLV